MKIYHNPRCRKSRETLQILQENKFEVDIVEYLVHPPTADELKSIVQMLNISPEALIRKGETEYKENFKGKKLTDNEWIEAMVKYPKLIERPIVIKNKKAVLGRPPENVYTLMKD